MVDAEAARFRLADLRYRNGVASYLDVLDAQRSLFVAQLATVQVQLSRLQNQVTLYKVLGGGWTGSPRRKRGLRTWRLHARMGRRDSSRQGPRACRTMRSPKPECR